MEKLLFIALLFCSIIQVEAQKRLNTASHTRPVPGLIPNIILDSLKLARPAYKEGENYFVPIDIVVQVTGSIKDSFGLAVYNKCADVQEFSATWASFASINGVTPATPLNQLFHLFKKMTNNGGEHCMELKMVNDSNTQLRRATFQGVIRVRCNTLPLNKRITIRVKADAICEEFVNANGRIRESSERDNEKTLVVALP
jgi:hypothetical protein